ncbi:MAG TPA: iron-containing alcohol dehydrogenase [Verrucomicrobiae bacterium]|nr:iron-containing alcohol dehydrogenase [Verrucomicrobiae bacterium]
MKFNSKAEIHLTHDLAKTVLEILGSESSTGAGVIVDSNMAAHAEVVALFNALREKKLLGHVFQFQSYEPTTDLVDQVAAEFRGGSADFLIGIGGGSTLDLAKAVSAMAVMAGKVTDYHGTPRPVTAALKKIMVPTTAGTGSEVTPGAVLVNTATSFKRALGGRHICPDYAVLCPALTLGMPVKVMVATGMDAMAHAIESYTAKCANTVTRMYARQSFRLVARTLSRALHSPNDLAIREELLLGSCLAGYSIYNSNTGACHALAYPLGIYHKVPHGVAVALILPHVIGHNVRHGCDLYADLLLELEGQNGKSASRAEMAAAFSCFVAGLEPLRALDARLGHYGIDSGRVPFLAERGLDLVSALSNNPVPFGLADADTVLRQIL